MKFFRISKLKKHTNKEAILKGIWDANEQRKEEEGSKPRLSAEALETKTKSNAISQR